MDESAEAETEETENETDGEKIGRLVGYLQGEELVEWEQVEECVSGFPGWLRMTEMMRYPSATVDRRLMPRERPTTDYTVVSDYTRGQLLEIFRPYALLLDAARTPSERARALHEADYDTIAFCKENQSNGSRDIAGAAKAILEACRAEKDLLRGSARPAVSARDALRPAPAGAIQDDSLLSPSQAPPPVEPKPGLFARLKAKLERH